MAGHIHHGIGIGQRVIDIVQAVIFGQAAGDADPEIAGVALLPMGGCEGKPDGIFQNFALPPPEGKAPEAAMHIVAVVISGQEPGLLPYPEFSFGDGPGKPAHSGA